MKSCACSLVFYTWCDSDNCDINLTVLAAFGIRNQAETEERSAGVTRLIALPCLDRSATQIISFPNSSAMPLGRQVYRASKFTHQI